jgi:hypothetical protein
MASTDTMRTVYVAERNGQCQHCGHRFYSSEPNPAPICYHCKSAGRTIETAEPVENRQIDGFQPSAPITYCGHVVDALGFTQDSFTRAMARAFCDDLQIKPYHDGRHIVHHAGLTGGYVATREHCTCKAGCAGTPCKHRAFLIACLDIREPHVRRQWAKLNRERPIRKAAAA